MKLTYYQTEIRSVLDKAAKGDGGLLLLVGGPGVGKTTLLGTLKDQAAQSGALYLSASGFADETGAPFNVTEQLIRSSRRIHGLDAVADWLVNEDQLLETERETSRNLVQKVSKLLHGIAGDKQLIIAVDNAEYADAPSLKCIAHIARHARVTGTLVVMAYGQTQFFPEVFSCQNLYKIEIGTLLESEVGYLLERNSDADLAARIRASCYSVSGGNPQLVKALLRDHLKAAPDPSEIDVAVGSEFRETYRCFLLQHQALLRVAQALAVLGPHGSPKLVAALLERSEEHVIRDIYTLNSAGLLDNGCFRHPAARSAALEDLTEEDRSRLSAKAAEFLYNDGADSVAVAEFLIIADNKPSQEDTAVLWHAAQKNLVNGCLEEAIDCLRLADRADLGQRQHLDILMALIGALWASNPAAAERDLDRMMALLRSDPCQDIPERYLHFLLFTVLWFGRSNDVEEISKRILSHGRGGDNSSKRADLWILQQWVNFLKPKLILDFPGEPHPAAEVDGLGAAKLEHDLQLPMDSLGIDIGYLKAPEQVADFSSEAIDLLSPASHFWFAYTYSCTIFWSLVARGGMEAADRLCDALFAAAENLGMKALCAVVLSMRSHIRCRRGDFVSAIDIADNAFRSLSPKGWGVSIGLPLSVLVAANTAIGRMEEAERYLKYWVPTEMFDSVVGLEYLRARGQYCLATNRPHAALNDFMVIGMLVEKWPVDFLDLVSWRIHAAEAYMHLHEPSDARRLVLEELELLPDRSSSTRGRALRVLAMTEEPDKRRSLLDQSARHIRKDGDCFELARTLAELSRDYLSTGETQQARRTWHEAQKLIDECGMSLQDENQLGIVPDLEGTADPEESIEGEPDLRDAHHKQPLLSEAEWRVATLAASKMTNRDIAKNLYITVSTVEQHLTRVYRKLSVTNRQELSRRLWSGSWRFSDSTDLIM